MDYLNKPLENSRINLKNRLVMPPMATSKSEADGGISKDILEYYDEKTNGGYISLVIIEHSFVSKQGKANNRQLSVADDCFVENLKDLAQIVHKNGSKTVMQINHAGSAATKAVTGMDAVGPSAVLNPAQSGELPKELDKNQISDIVCNFKNAALRVQKAGFDGVEIHSAHGYLLNQFLSPLTNKRCDEYGGNINGRIKIHLEIIKAIRDAVGESFIILLRLGASDYMEGGLTIDDSKVAASEFEKAGVDILDISGGFCRFNIAGNDKPGYFSPLSKAIKEVVAIPVIVTGGISSAAEADEILRDEKADLIGVGRAIYSDSAWAKNAMDNL
jgi:2,4-dienoyl-CoA reductase-like NADH-dependent reductase (Old Yellow Enzyme family)